jgi:hypothetical protein
MCQERVIKLLFMKKILPIFFIIVFCFFTLFSPTKVSAQSVTPVPTGVWVVDPEVTFIGKNAARSGLLLDWTLRNYNWVCVTQISNRQCDDSHNPIAGFWSTIVYFIVVPLLFLVILATAIIIILTRGRSLTISRFIPRFIFVILLIVFSYSIIQFFYQFTDLIQGFFLRTGTNSCPPDCISQKDLLFVGWDYKSFVGLRLTGDAYTESAFVSLLLTKLTALTYFVMSGILLIRKIILWFFVIISPIFPLLLLYYPVRNTGKVWIGEFFRWVLYAPLFAIFLKGLVYLWQHQIPLIFIPPAGQGAIGDPNQVVFPTAINILLGGPQQLVSPTNSVNLTETFALYVVALIMLWIVVLLPWILLQIFLDYATSISADNTFMQTLSGIVNKNQATPSPTQPSVPSPVTPEGVTLNLPFAKKFIFPLSLKPTGAAKEVSTEKSSVVSQAHYAKPAVVSKAQVRDETIRLANVTVPTIRDIARYETALLSKDKTQQEETRKVRETLEKIANPEKASTTEREHYKEVQEKLIHESYLGNTLATSILRASTTASQTATIQASTTQTREALQQLANPSLVTTTTERERITQLNQALLRESRQNNNQLATSILSVSNTTADSEIERIRRELVQTAQQGNILSTSVITTVNTNASRDVETAQMRTILAQLANPATTTSALERERYTEIHNALIRESKENNNQLATSILSVSDKTSVAELSHIREQLREAKSASILSRVTSTIQEHQSTETLKTILAQIANPSSVTNTIDRERMISLNSLVEKESSERHSQLASSILEVNQKTSGVDIERIREQLMTAKEQNNVMATSVVSTISNVASKQQTTAQVKEILQQIANPNLVTSVIERQRFQDLHTALLRESQENNNQIATSILAVNDKTDTTAIEKIREQLREAKENTVINTVNTLLGQQQATASIRSIFQKLVNPALATSSQEREQFTKLHESVIKEQQHKNELAQAILSVTDKTPNREIEMLRDRGKIAREQGNPLATQIAAVTDKTASLPVVNRVQTVNQEDYQAIKQLWRDNYQNLEIPQGMASTREEWMKDDIKSIDRIIGMLTSQDPERVNLGMQEVSSILPFLLMGGFSLTEVIAYLKAKQEAAQEALLTVNKEEEKVEVKVASKNQAATQTLAATIEENNTPVSAIRPNNHTITPQVSHEILTMTALTIPTIKDIVRYETRDVRNDAELIDEVKKMRDVLDKIANPISIADTGEKERFKKLREKLLEESKSGNATAETVLSAASKDETNPSQTNRLQHVSAEDFEEVKKMWEENYRTLPVPQGFPNTADGRIEWLTKEVEDIKQVLTLLQSQNVEDRKVGLRKVSNILPFLLLGGFSFREILGYLTAKLNAAQTVLKELKTEEEKLQTVDVSAKKEEKPKAMATEEEENNS